MPWMRDLTLVDQQPEIGLALEHHLGDLVEGHLDDGRVAHEEPQQQRRGGVAARDRDHLALEVLAVDRLRATRMGP